MPTALLCEACGLALRLPEPPPVLGEAASEAIPAELFADLEDPRWGWGRRSPFALAPAIAACGLMADHAAHGCRLVSCGEGPVLREGDGRPAEELGLDGQADPGSRRREPELRRALEAAEAGEEQDRAQALAAARGWLGEPEERDRRLRLGAAAAFARIFRGSLREDGRCLRVLPAGSEERRGAYARAVEALRAAGGVNVHLARACRLAARELSAEHPAGEALEADLRAIVADQERSSFDRGRAFALLMASWPARPTELRSLGVLATESAPTWERWDRMRSHQESARLCAAAQDPEALRAVLEDETRPAGCQLGVDDSDPADRWAIEAAAQVAAELAGLEPERAADFEPALRARLSRLPEGARFKPQRLIQAHGALLAIMPRAEAEGRALEVLERFLDAGRFEESGAWVYLRLWSRAWRAEGELAERLRGRVADAAAEAAARIAARAALAELARAANAEQREAVREAEAEADAALVEALRSSELSSGLGAALRQHLDRWLPVDAVVALREEGLLEARALPPYPEVAGASTGNGNALYPALDELARKVEPAEILAALERVSRCQTEEDVARGLTALNLLPRMAKSRGGFFDQVWGRLAPLFGEARRLVHPRRSWTIDQEAFKAALEMVPLRLKEPLEDAASLLRAALAGALEREEAPESYFAKVGRYGAGALSRLFQARLQADEKARLAGWLERVLTDRGRGAYARINAFYGIEGLGSAEALAQAERRLLAQILEPEEAADLKAEAHALLASRLPAEVAQAQEAGLLPALDLPAVEALHAPAQGGLMRLEPKVAAGAARQHPGRLVAAIADPETPIERLCAALLFAADARRRGADPEAWAGALRGRLSDRRAHEAGGGRWVVCALAAEADIAAHKKEPEGLRAGLDRALAAEVDGVAALYEPWTSRGEARRAAADFGPLIARGYALALAASKLFDPVFEELAVQVEDRGASDEVRLGALDALSIMVARAPRGRRSALEERRGALVAELESAGLVASGEAVDGLFMAADWAAMKLPPFAWVKR